MYFLVICVNFILNNHHHHHNHHHNTNLIFNFFFLWDLHNNFYYYWYCCCGSCCFLYFNILSLLLDYCVFETWHKLCMRNHLNSNRCTGGWCTYIHTYVWWIWMGSSVNNFEWHSHRNQMTTCIVARRYLSIITSLWPLIVTRYTGMLWHYKWFLFFFFFFVFAMIFLKLTSWNYCYVRRNL